MNGRAFVLGTEHVGRCIVSLVLKSLRILFSLVRTIGKTKTHPVLLPLPASANRLHPDEVQRPDKIDATARATARKACPKMTKTLTTEPIDHHATQWFLQIRNLADPVSLVACLSSLCFALQFRQHLGRGRCEPFNSGDPCV